MRSKTKGPIKQYIQHLKDKRITLMFYISLSFLKSKIAYLTKVRNIILIRLKYMVYACVILSGEAISASDYPQGVCGVACFDFSKEQLPPMSRGIYKICEFNNEIKYIGSALDINQRLTTHVKNGILIPGNIVHAIVFHSTTRQKEILDYERLLINKFTPRLNRTNGTPGRPWRSEQLSKLKVFSAHNKHLLTDESQLVIGDLLNGKCLYENRKIAKSLFRIMRFFR
jgi:hypothetical protein